MILKGQDASLLASEGVLDLLDQLDQLDHHARDLEFDDTHADPDYQDGYLVTLTLTLTLTSLSPTMMRTPAALMSRLHDRPVRRTSCTAVLVVGANQVGGLQSFSRAGRDTGADAQDRHNLDGTLVLVVVLVVLVVLVLIVLSPSAPYGYSRISGENLEPVTSEAQPSQSDAIF
ncbi:hypothetical protein EG329_003788 [Mollisiaceae sp. DMI_Dod_QoI]|nr:hypothetical protein EG329_003788 [Helotiales sp. DMI_Dod_QoI]